MLECKKMNETSIWRVNKTRISLPFLFHWLDQISDGQLWYSVLLVKDWDVIHNCHLDSDLTRRSPDLLDEGLVWGYLLTPQFIVPTTGYPNKKFPVTLGSILSQSQAFSTESNQSQSSIHVNIMVPGVAGNFLLGYPVSEGLKLQKLHMLSEPVLWIVQLMFKTIQTNSETGSAS